LKIGKINRQSIYCAVEAYYNLPVENAFDCWSQS
jgi:hypothetical protein